MTAEIALLNSLGIALAADSALTVRGEKVYHTCDKLFTLSKYRPVGIMVYGNTDFLGTPWEVLIRKYRSRLKQNSFDTIGGYVDSFLEYLRKCFLLDQRKYFFNDSVRFYYLTLVNKILALINKEINEKKGIEDSQIEEFVSKEINNLYEDLMKREDLSEFQQLDYSNVIYKENKESVDNIIKEIFWKLPRSDEDERKLHSIAGLIYTKNFFDYNNYTGIVIAGYGNKEDYPALVEIMIEGMIDEKIKYYQNESLAIKYNDSQGIVRAFAMKDMILDLIAGVSPRTMDTFKSALDNTILGTKDILLTSNLVSKMPEKDKMSLSEDLQSASSDYATNVRKDLEKHIIEENQEKFLRVIGDLPKDELANVAETLVSYTSFKFRVWENMDVVGGPIDVALITKGDGFIWIKRKQYFSQDLNFQFTNNYYRDDLDDELDQ